MIDHAQNGDQRLAGGDLRGGRRIRAARPRLSLGDQLDTNT